MDAIRTYWSEQMIRDAALKFEIRADFKKSFPSAYSAARRLKILDDVCSHMDVLLTPWTKEMIWDKALICKTRTELMESCWDAYKAAHRRGILDEVCSHMERPYVESDAVYIWKANGQYFNGELVYKIGITTFDFDDRRIQKVAKAHGFTPVDLVMHQVENPREVEKHLLTFGFNPQYIGDGATEFRSLSDAEYKEAIAYLESCAVEREEEVA